MRPLKGGAVRKHAVEAKPSFYTEPFWSPDSRTIVFSDRRLGLWVFDVATGKAERIDRSNFMAQRLWNPSWSPDSRYLAYAKALPNHHRAIVVWDRTTGQNKQITDAFSHAEFPSFDASGRYLYFSGSANARNASASDVGWALLSDFDAQPLVLKRLYAVVLRPQDSAPVLPYGSQANPLASYDPAEGVVNWEQAKTRVVPLGLAPRDIAGLYAAKPGILLVQTNDWDPAPGRWTSQSRLYRLDLRRPTEFLRVADPCFAASLSADRSKAVIAGQGGSLRVFATDAPISDPEQGASMAALDLSQDSIDIDPAQEWRQLYRESWRMMRDYFYDPNHHGQDLGALERHFSKFLPGLVRRTDMNTLLRFAFGEVSISHLAISGGDAPPPTTRRPPNRTGLLGADWKVENGRFRIEKILHSGHFLDARPLARAPLDQPGIDVRVGDYLIEVEGKPVAADQNIHHYFRGTAQRPTKVKFSTNPNGSGAREFTVVPAASEAVIRLVNWSEANRRWVEEKSGGKLVYVHLSDFDEDGFDGIYRTVNGLKPGQGLIWDQRFNGGGITADSLVQMLKREPMLGYMYPHGDPFDVPAHRLDGPAVLIVNEQNGSAAETFALMFKAMGAGTIVGTHTYGAGVGVALSQQRLIDGGRIGIPNRASHNPLTGQWEIENFGVKPHIEVDITTADFAAGRDPQLEKAVETAMQQLAGWKPRALKRPSYPIHSGGG